MNVCGVAIGRRCLIACFVVAVLAAACVDEADAPADTDTDRPTTPAMELVTFTDVARDVGVEFRHAAFQWDVRSDFNAMMSGGMCWIDVDSDGWLDLFVVNTWSEGEWGRWRNEGALPTSRLFRNDRGRFTDVTDQWGVGVADRGSGCVAADLDLDGHPDLYVTTERHDVLLWNVDGDRFEADDGSAGIDTNGWHSGVAVGDVDGDGWPDLFVAGYADLNHPIPSTKGFPNPFAAEPDLLLVSSGGSNGRPTFTEMADEVGIEPDRVDYGLGAVLVDVDRDGDLDLYVANDTQPNRLYINEPDADAPAGFRLTDRAPDVGVDDDEAGMGVAIGDHDDDGRPDIVVTNLAGQGHAAFRSTDSTDPWGYEPALAAMGLADLGQDLTGWGTTWGDLDLDGDLDLAVAHGDIPVRDLDADRQQLQVFENLTVDGERGTFAEVTAMVGLDPRGRFLARGLAAADYDNDGDLDLAVGTVGSDLALLRNTGAGGHWLLVSAEPATPGTRVIVTANDGTSQEREIIAGSSYLSSEDSRAHFGLGAVGDPVTVEVVWPDGTHEVRPHVAPDQIVLVAPP